MASATALAACAQSPSNAQDTAAPATPAVSSPASTLPPAITAAAADPARGADAATTDARRHGPEILAFAGVKPGDKVIDLIPGGAYWTKLFAKTVGASGHVYGIWPTPYAGEARTNVIDYQKLAGSADFANVSTSIEPANEIKAAEPVDLVFTSQNYHDYLDKFMGPVDPAVFNKAVFDALKPGGIFLIVDHAAPAGSGTADTDTLHRIDPATVKQQVTAAGFEFVGSSDLLANPADDHTLKVFDPAIRGKTDQFIYKFRKPG
ncbi:methyltransferase [Sphingomonas koreensis]|nr:methyltransferase [Sphingomonas koreensis]